MRLTASAQAPSSLSLLRNEREKETRAFRRTGCRHSVSVERHLRRLALEDQLGARLLDDVLGRDAGAAFAKHEALFGRLDHRQLGDDEADPPGRGQRQGEQRLTILWPPLAV